MQSQSTTAATANGGTNSSGTTATAAVAEPSPQQSDDDPATVLDAPTKVIDDERSSSDPVAVEPATNVVGQTDAAGNDNAPTTTTPEAANQPVAEPESRDTVAVAEEEPSNGEEPNAWDDDENDGLDDMSTDGNATKETPIVQEQQHTDSSVPVAAMERDEEEDPAPSVESEKVVSSPDNVVEPHQQDQPTPATNAEPLAVETAAETAAETQSPQQEQTSSRHKLVVLISSTAMSRQVKSRQDLVFTALDSAQVSYDVLDGSEQQELRQTLLEVSGLPAIEYPLFFLIRLRDGGQSYWGNWDTFAEANENKRLGEAFSQDPPTPSTPSTPPSPSPTAATARVLAPSSSVEDEPASAVQERFTQQLARLEEHHQTETASLQAAHAQEIATLQETAERLRTEVQQRAEAQILAKEEQLKDLCRRNEGYRLKLDVLKREVTGTQELLEEKNSAAGKAGEKFLQDLRAMERKAMEAEAAVNQAGEERKRVEVTLETTRQELANAQKEHSELKERVKVVATELKERRVECRDLKSKMDEAMDEKAQLQEKIDSLSERLNHQGVSQGEKEGEMAKLRGQIVDAQTALEKAQAEWKEKEASHERSLTEYKRKAQSSLSMANSRIAGAVQAREEAELDARAARTTADSAFERATKAEFASREAVAEAKGQIAAITKEREEAVQKLDDVTQQLNTVTTALASTEAKLQQAMDGRDTKATALEELRTELRAVQLKLAECEQRLSDGIMANKRLQGDNEKLSDQLQNAKAELSSKRSNENSVEHPVVESFSASQLDEAKFTELKEELKEANEAIEGLKEALKQALEDSETKNNDSSNTNGDHGGFADGGQADGSIPLFYAMEKQAELKTARAEINRLASALADVQSEKAEATDGMQSMKKRMEEAESRLKRFKKLSAQPGTPADETNGGSGPTTNSGAVNVEYLKHITLKFVSATTTVERKALVPVIGAILELTPDEMSKATASVEQTSSASSFFGF